MEIITLTYEISSKGPKVLKDARQFPIEHRKDGKFTSSTQALLDWAFGDMVKGYDVVFRLAKED